MRPIFRLPSNRQPQGVVQLDRTNPLNAAPAFMQVATIGKELVSGAIVKPGGTTPPVVRGTPSGVAQQFTTGAATVSFLDLGLPLGPSVDLGKGTPTTWVGVFYANTTAGVAIAERSDGNAADIGWGFGYVAGSGGGANFGLGFVKEWGSVNTRKSINESVTAGLNTLVVTYDGGFPASGINIYLNGVLGTTKGTGDGSGSGSTDAGQNLYIGRQRYDTSKAHDGTILLAGAYRRIWTAAEVASFHRNPWQLFASPAREMLVESGGVSAYSLPYDAASYALTAATEALVATRALPVTAASYALTPSAVTLGVGRALGVAATSYALSASSEALTVDRKLDISAASYALTAANVTLTYTPIAVGVDFAAASYSLTTAAESFGVERKLAYDAATYTLSAASESLVVSRALGIAAASYALTASAETLTATRALSIDPASYALSAAPVTLTYASLNKTLDIDPASYALSLADVGFTAPSRGTEAEPQSYPGPQKKGRTKTYNYDYSSPKAPEPVAKQVKPGKVKPKKSVPDDVAEMLRLLESSQEATAQVLAEQKSIFAIEAQRLADEEDELIAVIAMAL